MTANILETFMKNPLEVYKTVYVPKESSGQLRPAPAAVPFGVGCPGDLAQQGVVILAVLA